LEKNIEGIMGLIDLGHEGDPVLTRVVDEDKVKWYKKPNLRILYLLMYPTCMGIEITSGFDSQMINALQFITPWNQCSSLIRFCHCESTIVWLLGYLLTMILDFGVPTIDGSGALIYALEPNILGLVNGCYNLGAVFAVPFVPWVAQRVGRRWSIFFGSLIQCIGAILAGFAQNGTYIFVTRSWLWDCIASSRYADY
jgi:hypothetical protein